MNLSHKIDQDLPLAQRAGETERVATLRLLKSSLKNEQIKLGRDLGEAEVLKLLQREAKQRRDSIAAYSQANRPDLVEAEQTELDIINAYLPQSLGEAELDKIITDVITETGASSAAQMGMVIAAVMQRAGGAAEGAVVAQKVRHHLAG